VIVAVCVCALLCLIEGGEAMARAAARPPDSRRRTGAAVAGAAVVLLACSAVAGLAATARVRWLPVIAGAIALLAGLQWLARAVRRLLGPVPQQRSGVFQTVVAGGAEVVLITTALAVVVLRDGGPTPPWVWPVAGVSVVIGLAAYGAVTRRARRALPQRIPKALLATALTAAAATGIVHNGLPVGGWAAGSIAVVGVTVLVVRFRNASTTRSTANSGLRGFLFGDDATTWLGAAIFALLGPALGLGWLPLLMAVVGVALLRVTSPATG
jgi:hypothetical protein